MSQGYFSDRLNRPVGPAGYPSGNATSREAQAIKTREREDLLAWRMAGALRRKSPLTKDRPFPRYHRPQRRARPTRWMIMDRRPKKSRGSGRLIPPAARQSFANRTMRPILDRSRKSAGYERAARARRRLRANWFCSSGQVVRTTDFASAASPAQSRPASGTTAIHCFIGRP